MQFNLQSGEVPIIASGKVTFAEERSVSIHTRGHGGLSIPVGGGCYYHLGLTQGQTERVSGLQAIDVGEMLITNQALYFGGQQKTLRMSLKDVIRYQPYVDAVGVCESGSPRVFVPDYRGMDTGWFFYNLLTALTSKLTQ